MIKKFVCSMLTMLAVAAFGAVEVNTANQAELESVKGVGPAISAKIVGARKKSTFKDWADLVDRVKGLGKGNAAKLSAAGLTVNGTAYQSAPAKPQLAQVDKDSTKAKAGTAASTPKGNKK